MTPSSKPDYRASQVLRYACLTLYTAQKKDGVGCGVRRLAEIAIEIGSLLRHLAPPLLRALLPGYSPRSEQDPSWVKEWVTGHAALPSGAVLPLINTLSIDLPTPFERAPPA